SRDPSPTWSATSWSPQRPGWPPPASGSSRSSRPSIRQMDRTSERSPRRLRQRVRRHHRPNGSSLYSKVSNRPSTARRAPTTRST
ncbi:uncharacterized protein METZ01_LOCUS297587, partial [marine metagenome]